MSLTRRHIQFKFTLGEGAFSDGAQTTTIEGLRCSVEIERVGLGYAQADARIYGMSRDLMNRLATTTQFYMEQRKQNTLTILAGDDDGGMAVCFTGTIFWAWMDARQQPDVSFYVSAMPGLYDAAQAVPPVSFKGTVDVALVARGVAEQMGYSFYNSGVDARVTSPYLPGTPKAQLEALCRAADCMHEIDETNQRVAIWPRGGAKDGDAVEVSPDTGLISHPAFTQQGLSFSSLYNPSIEFGRNVKIKSALTPANGEWTVIKLSHSLEAEMPDGRWFTDVECIYPGLNYDQ